MLESVGGVDHARRDPDAVRRTSSSRTGAARRAGPDPWHGPTLEWTIPSPPPEYNFAVIPTVTSAYPNWDVADRETDRRVSCRASACSTRGTSSPSRRSWTASRPTSCGCRTTRRGRSCSRSACARFFAVLVGPEVHRRRDLRRARRADARRLALGRSRSKHERRSPSRARAASALARAGGGWRCSSRARRRSSRS